MPEFQIKLQLAKYYTPRYIVIHVSLYLYHKLLESTTALF